MREILFRGKRKDNGEWEKGSFWDDCGKAQILTEGNCIAKSVNPDTVGQFTGLTDKDGKWIFEGDIVKTYRNEDIFDKMMVVWYEDSASFVLATSDDFYWCESLMNSHIYLEIIGNIHDNPELMGGKQ